MYYYKITLLVNSDMSNTFLLQSNIENINQCSIKIKQYTGI